MKNTIIKTEDYILTYDTEGAVKYYVYEAQKDDVVEKLWIKREYDSLAALIDGENTSNELANIIEVIISIDKADAEFADDMDGEVDDWFENHKFTIGMGSTIRQLSWNPASANELDMLRKWLCIQAEYELSLY